MSAPSEVLGRASEGRALRTLLAAAAVGIAGDLLLRGGMWRAGVATWMVGVVVTAMVLGDADRERRLLLVGLLAAALGLALRDAPYLWPVDFLSMLCMGALVVWHASGRRVADLTIVQAARAAVLAVLTVVGGGSAVLRDGVADGGGSAETGRRARLIAFGVVLAIPPLLLVATLLGESDAVFGGFVREVIDFLSRRAVQHAMVAGLLAWAAAGWLRAASGERVETRVSDPASPAAPFLLLSVGIYGMIALLALFLGTQARVLYGGEAYLQDAVGLTRAEYARHGFFEMVAASGIVLGSLAIADWLMAEEDGGRRRFRAAGTILVVQVLAILASAVTRMAMYMAEYGLSTERAFASAIMVWVAATLVAFGLTTLRGRSARFAPVVLVVTIVWVALLNAVNLEALVVRVNVARAVQGDAFDWSYHAHLSGDALPALRAQASRLPAEVCQQLENKLIVAWGARGRNTDEQDWRSTNLPMAAARTWLAADGRLDCADPAAGAPAR